MVFQRGPDWLVKLTDFGISKRAVGTQLRTFAGTFAYSAPEVRELYTAEDLAAGDVGTYSFGVDVWAVGAITFRAITGGVAFQAPGQLTGYVVQGSPFPVEELRHASVTAECVEFVQRTMAASPRRRPTSNDALSHPWMELSIGNSRSGILPFPR